MSAEPNPTAAVSHAASLFVWSPVLLVFGIWGYFAVQREPALWLSMAGFTLATCFLVLWRHVVPLAIIALLMAGFFGAGLRSQWVATPLVRAFIADVKFAGRVSDIERRGKVRHVMVLDIVTASGVPVDEIPRRVRLTANFKQAVPRIGDSISGKAHFVPLPMPVAPGHYDWGRALYFQSIGATGRVLGDVAVMDGDVPWRYQVRRQFHAIRQAIGARIMAVIEGPLGSFADALITGERAQIPKPMNQSLQASGLFHVLSISGLHMALVVGGCFWLVRGVLALSPSLALRRPIKAWAAGAALLAGLFYMLLADSGAATERSFLMIAVMLFAVMVNRPALSLHNLAVAAVVILALSPEQAVAASFQMSFLAVMGLAAFFMWWRRRVETRVPHQRGLVGEWLRKGLLLAGASLVTSLLAGGLSGIAAAHHFGRVAPYSVVANAVALPLVSLVVMPMALASVLLMPLGLEHLPLLVMELGLKGLMGISDGVAAWPGAGVVLPRLSGAAAACLATAAAVFVMAGRRLRWAGLPLCVVAVALQVWTSKPTLLVEERARTVALRNDEGVLVPLPAKGVGFSVAGWLEAEGQVYRRGKAQAKIQPPWTCTASTCEAAVNGLRVAFLRAGEGNVFARCPRADVVVANYPLRRTCAGRLATIDRFDVWRQGAHAVTFDDGKATVETVRAWRGARPWNVAPRARGGTYKPPTATP